MKRLDSAPRTRGTLTRQVDNYGVRHTLKKRGDPIAEARRSQIAVATEDFALLTTVTDVFDDVWHDGRNNLGREVLVFTKEIDSVCYWHAAEIRAGKRLVVTDSLRKKPGA